MIKKLIALFVLLIIISTQIIQVNAITKHEVYNDGCNNTIDSLDYKLIEPTLVNKVVQLGDLIHNHFMRFGLVKQYIIFGTILVKLREKYSTFKQNPKGDRKRNIVKVLDDILACKLPILKGYIDNGYILQSDDGGKIEDSEENKNKVGEIEAQVENSKDTTGPVIRIIGDNPLEIEFGSHYNERGASVRDMRDTLVEITIGGDTVDIEQLGVYSITYTATDNSGNTTTETKIVKVVDTIAPNFEIDTSLPTNIEYGENINLIDYVKNLFDGADENVSITISPSSIDTTNPGTYTVIFSATDASGNTSEEQTIIFTVEEEPIVGTCGSAIILF